MDISLSVSISGDGSRLCLFDDPGLEADGAARLDHDQETDDDEGLTLASESVAVLELDAMMDAGSWFRSALFAPAYLLFVVRFRPDVRLISVA